MSQQQLLIQVVSTLDRLGIDYMLTGSVASGALGVPRSTHDIDLVVAISRDQVDRLVAAFPEQEFYLDAAAVRSAIAHRQMFNLLSLGQGDKVDFWVFTDDPFSQAAFGRRRQRTIAGRQIWVTSPEDLIVQKLRWARESGGSEKQAHDVRGIVEMQADALDRTYIERWTRHFDIHEAWLEILRKVQELE
ncbi:MAG: hypothetical protein WD042_08035 [Phycisphaeraceae bacterium]